MLTCVGFASQVNLPVVEVEGVNKLLVETDEFETELDFVGDVRYTLREANTDGLFNPKHVCQIDPGVGILDRLKSSSFPSEGAVLCQKTTEGTAAGATIEPNSDLICGVGVGRREEPEEELASLVGCTTDGQKTGVRLANIEVDIGESRAIDPKFCDAISRCSRIVVKGETHSRSRC